jgi:hypothetical protein
MFDIRSASRADLDRLNAEMLEWKSRKSADPQPQSLPDEDPQIPAPSIYDQLDLFPPTVT